MIDIKLIRENRELVKENIKKKFQDRKLALVDEIYELDILNRKLKQDSENLKALKNKKSKEIGQLFAKKLLAEAEALKQEIANFTTELEALSARQVEIDQEIKSKMMLIPNIIADDVPIGKDDSENVEVKRYMEAKDKDFEVPYHTDILQNLNGCDLEAARTVAGNGFYFLQGDVALLHSAILTYAREFMIQKGFTYVIPPYMLRSDSVRGVMSFEEMENMMFKIEGEDLFLVGTSEHSMIAKFKDRILKHQDMPYTYTSYSPCFRKEKGAHGIEERGIYRVHQFEKQEMIVVCTEEDSYDWFNKMYNYTAEFFTSLDIPTRALECCSGDLADLKVKSIDIEAYSPRQKKYFEVGSCSYLGDAQARRLGIRYDDANGERKFAHTLNNTVVAPPRMLIAFLENNLNADGSINIPKALQKYMLGKEKIVPFHVKQC